MVQITLSQHKALDWLVRIHSKSYSYQVSFGVGESIYVSLHDGDGRMFYDTHIDSNGEIADMATNTQNRNAYDVGGAID
jgi:hypothetical protein